MAMLGELRRKIFSPEGATVVFGAVAAGVDAVAVETFKAGVFRPERGWDYDNILIGGAVLITNLRFAMQLAYLGERRGIYPRIYNRGYVLTTKLTHSLPPIF